MSVHRVLSCSCARLLLAVRTADPGGCAVEWRGVRWQHVHEEREERRKIVSMSQRGIVRNDNRGGGRAGCFGFGFCGCCRCLASW